MRTRLGTFSGVRGVPIAHREWLPDGEALGTVVIAHGIHEHGGRYQHVAARLVADGWVVGSLDHRGHGLSGGRRGAVERFEDWVTDLDTYIADVLARTPQPVFLVGHSLGGLIACVYTLRHADRLRGLVLSSPAVLAPAGLSPTTVRAGRLLSRFAANLPVIALRRDAVSRDPAVVKAYLGDALVHPGRIRARTGAEILDATLEVRRRAAEIVLPLLAVQGSADLLVDPGAAAWIDSHAGSPDHTLRVYEGLYHEVFNEPERDLVLDDVAAWLGAHR
ncbi:MAG: lysophospholipase [Candidatus Dormibacteraeota bacterium]|nr:lysophospholipase [Candidatus Dormibacteraeota bacterium]